MIANSFLCVSVSIHFGKLNGDRTGFNHGTTYKNGILTENWSIGFKGYYMQLELK